MATIDNDNVTVKTNVRVKTGRSGTLKKINKKASSWVQDNQIDQMIGKRKHWCVGRNNKVALNKFQQVLIFNISLLLSVVNSQLFGQLHFYTYDCI